MEKRIKNQFHNKTMSSLDFNNIKSIKLSVNFDDGKEYGVVVPMEKGYEEITLRNFARSGAKGVLNRIADKISKD